jgi:hypothetical protein
MIKLNKDDSDLSELSNSSSDEHNRIDLEQLQIEAAPLVEAFAEVTAYLRSIELTPHEYVLLKVLLLTELPDQALLGVIYRTHLGALAKVTGNRFDRFQRLLKALPAVQQAAEMLIRSKMFYVPYLLTATVTQSSNHSLSGRL